MNSLETLIDVCPAIVNGLVSKNKHDVNDCYSCSDEKINQEGKQLFFDKFEVDEFKLFLISQFINDVYLPKDVVDDNLELINKLIDKNVLSTMQYQTCNRCGSDEYEYMAQFKVCDNCGSDDVYGNEILIRFSQLFIDYFQEHVTNEQQRFIENLDFDGTNIAKINNKAVLLKNKLKKYPKNKLF